MKKRKKAILLASSLAFVGVVSAFSLIKNENIELLGLESIEETYYIDDEFTVPEVKVKYQNKEYDSTAYVTYPSGNVSQNKTITLSEYGIYNISYLAHVEDKIIRKEVSFTVLQKMYSIVGSKSTVTYGKHEYMGDEEGIILNLAQNEKFTFNKPIDLSKYNSANKLISFSVIPETIGVADASKIIVTLTDRYDETNYIKIEIKKCDDNLEKWAEVNTYVTANCATQDAIGLEAYQTTGNLITYNGNIYRFHRNNPYGANISFSLAGAPRFESKQNPNYDPSYLKEQTFDLSMDYDTGIIYAGSNTTFVTDLKSDVIYGNNLWEGFTTGEAYLSLQATNYNAEKLNLFINSIANENVSKYADNVYVDDKAPEITIDLKGYDEDSLPNAKVNQRFNLFDATAYDEFDKEVEVKKEVYINRGLKNECKINVNNNAFIPTYKATYEILYTAKDSFGNVATKVIKINVDDNGNSLEIDKITNGDLVGYAGKIVNVNKLTYKNNEGKVSEKIVAINKDSKNEYDVNNYQFLPLEVGKYEIVYTYSDYLYQNEYKYEIDINKTDIPAIIDTINLPKYLIKDCAYTLPIIKGYEFTTGKKNEIATTIYVNEDNKGYVKLDSNIYTSKANETVSIKYVASFNNKEESIEKEVKVIDVNFSGSLNIGKYMYTNDFTFEATSKYIEYTTTKNGSSKMEFINKLQADNFQVKLCASEDKQNFNIINIYLTDSTSDETMKFTYEKTRFGTVRFYINDENPIEYDTLFAQSDNPITFEYDNESLTVSAHPNKYISLNDFKGFKSRYVYLTLEIINDNNNASIKVFNINGQPLSKVTGDIIDPRISASPSLGDKQINSIHTINAVTISDVLDTSMKSYMKVTDPDKEVVRSVDGILLDETASYERDYQIKLDKYGDYLIYYYAVDSNENEAVYSYVITVTDTTPPVVTIVNPQTEGNVNKEINIASIRISDNSSKTFTIYVCVKVPNGKIYSLVNVDETMVVSKSFTPQTTGKYTIYYYVEDESGNTSCVSYEINVR